MVGIMQIKKFDQVLHDKYDPPARKAVSDWIEMKWGFIAKDNPDKYGTDLIIYKNDKPIAFAEVEVRQWNPQCPFDTIHVPMRKKHMLEVPKTLFFALTQDMTHAYWILGEKTLTHPLWEMKDSTKHEAYYDVPKNLFEFVDLTEPF
jgi:hypothetical protein